MNVDNDLVEKLARLSKLNFTTEEKDTFIEDFGKILNFVEQLNAVDTEGVEPLRYVTEESNVLRPDTPHLNITKAEALMNAPDKDSDYIKVPKVLNQEF